MKALYYTQMLFSNRLSRLKKLSNGYIKRKQARGIKPCKYYPCHKDLHDCTFCICPFYPCLEYSTGGKLLKGVWDCSECIVPHNRIIVEFLLDKIKSIDSMENRKYLKKVKKMIQK